MNYERRRQELKDLTIERRHREEDQARMILEDQEGRLLREIDKIERQRMLYKKEFGFEEEEGDINAEEEAGESYIYI